MTQTVETYNGFTITRNEYGSYNVAACNCFSTPTLENARRAIRRYAEKCGLDETGRVRTARTITDEYSPMCGSPAF